MKHVSRLYAYLSCMAFLLIATLGANAAGTADATITGIADDGEATYSAIKAIAIVIFGALLGIGIFRKVWGKFVSRA